MCGQSGTDQFQGQLSSFRATTDRSIMIVQATGKFKISATRIGLEAGANRPQASCPLGVPVPLHKTWMDHACLLEGRRGVRKSWSFSVEVCRETCPVQPMPTETGAVMANGNRMALARFGLAVSLQSGVMGWTICKPASCTDGYNARPHRHAWAPGSVH